MQDFGPAASQRGPRGELAAGAASLRSQPGRQDPGDTRWELERESTAAESGPPCPEPATRPVPTAAVHLGHLPGRLTLTEVLSAGHTCASGLRAGNRTVTQVT